MNKRILAIVGLFITSLIVSWNLLKPGFYSMHDDLHVMRLYEMKQCIGDGQIPCRWSSDLGAGFGQPMFNYYSATPYYLGAIFNTLGFSYIDSVKLLIFISIFLAGLAMFLFLSEFLPALPAFIGATAYILVPFRALEVFVRGALAENFALALLPLVLYGIIRLIKRQDKTSFILLSLFSGLFLASHNITSLVSSLLIVSFSIVVIFQNKNKLKSSLLLLLSAILGVGIVAFFLFPVIFERNLIDTSFLTSGYFNFRAHFVTLNQLFINQSWGYGASEFGPNDKLSFAVGIIQSLAFIVAPLIVFFKRKTLQSNHKILLGLFWLMGIIYLFLTTSRSVGIWEIVSQLSFVQFPWRLLGVVAISSSVIIGIIVGSLGNKTQKSISAAVFIVLLLLNFRYFKFEKTFDSATDSTFLSGQGFTNQQLSAILDYRPISMKSIPENIAPLEPQVISGQVEVSNFQKRSNYFSADVYVLSGEGEVVFPISDFPNWTVYLNNGLSATQYRTSDYFGEITVTFKKGHNLIQGYFENTPIRSISNIVSFISLLLVLLIVLVPNDRKNTQKA